MPSEAESPEQVVARVLAGWRMDDPALVGPAERKRAAAITMALRNAGWRIMRGTTKG